MVTMRVMAQDGALCRHTGLTRAVGEKQDKRKAPTAAIRKLAVRDADLSPERIVALPEADDRRLASAVMAPLARDLETLTSSESS
jgi:hypothetical protein